MTGKIYFHRFSTDLGLISSLATEAGIINIFLPPFDRNALQKFISRKYPRAESLSPGEMNTQLEIQINQYLTGQRKSFELSLNLEVSPFQEQVLKQVAAIPYGRTATYGAIASAIGKPGASRAVGTANARNPLPLVIPCHRVVTSHGLGGYGGGLDMKKKLLAIEQYHI